MSETQVEQTEESAAVAVSRTIAAPPLHVWEVLVSPAGAESLLGPGASIGTKGQSWRSDEGPLGVVRSLHPLEQLRVTWHAAPEEPSSIVEIDLAADGDGTRLDLRQTPVAGDADAHEQRWDAALGRLEGVVLG